MANRKFKNQPSSRSLVGFDSIQFCRRVARLIVCLIVLQVFPTDLFNGTRDMGVHQTSGLIERFLSPLGFGPASAVASAFPTLDVDANGQVDVLTDGMLILRFLFVFKGAGLINGVLGPNGTRTTPDAVLVFLQDFIP